MKRETVAIVGAGLAGLNCARVLAENEIPFALYEQSETVGGRVQTDVVDGFLLDRGFQVLLAAYPEAMRTFDYDRLDLQPFYPGSLVQFRGRPYLVADPFLKPLAAVRGLLSPVGSLADKLKILKLRKRSLRAEIEAYYPAQEKSTDEYLDDFGFSKSMRQRFLDPFLSGVHLDPQLQTSSRMTEFVFRMFSTGPTVLPRRGMTTTLREQSAPGARPSRAPRRSPIAGAPRRPSGWRPGPFRSPRSRAVARLARK